MNKRSSIESRQQWRAMYRAYGYALTGHLERCELWVRNAYGFKPLTAMQWWRLRMLTGDTWTDKIYKELEGNHEQERAA